MFEVFGNMDSADEINKTAAGLRGEGDKQNLETLATENGIPVEMVEIYLSGEMDYLVDPIMAALGKIEMEVQDLHPKNIMEDWTEYIKGQCMESEEMAAAVRKKDRSLRGCMGALLKWSNKNMMEIDDGIKKAAGFSGNVKLGIPGIGQAKKIIMDYYKGGESNEKKEA